MIIFLEFVFFPINILTWNRFRLRPCPWVGCTRAWSPSSPWPWPAALKPRGPCLRRSCTCKQVFNQQLKFKWSKQTTKRSQAKKKKIAKATLPLKKMYISCTDPSCNNWFPDFLLVRQNSFTTGYPMNFQKKLVWQLGSVHKINIHLEATFPLRWYNFLLKKNLTSQSL